MNKLSKLIVKLRYVILIAAVALLIPSAIGYFNTRVNYDILTYLPEDIDAVLLTHLDCDHANGIKQVKGAKKFLVAADEVKFASQKSMEIKIRYNSDWWKDVKIKQYDWNDTQGPVGKSYDLLGDGSIELVNIPGHADGLFAVKVKNDDGKFVLLFSDGGYAKKSWDEMILSGIAADRTLQKKSLAWIREQSLDPDCVESLANHDTEIKPHIIEL